ncbi:MAG TPA: arginine--tRNA ligase [Solirubrobacteraceae bacterium]|jgi:arginyl-tRNA synthetase|nr:arginine--tRNA ligase [Solirubrobacteraceae bacterium]
MRATSISTPVDDLREAVLAGATALAGADGAGEGSGLGRPDAIVLERPPKADFGDYATNAALLLAPSLRLPPREVAERLGAELKRRLGERLQRFEVAGPGFLNLFLADTWLQAALVRVLSAEETFGAGGARPSERILVEFVSANPTGPMHVGHARNAAYGDSLARVLAFHGHEVEREFYVNDAGSQVRALGESIRVLARGEEVSEGGYRGDYVRELVTELDGAATLDPGELGRAAVAVMIARMQSTLRSFAVQGFDHWQYESVLHAGDPSPVAHTLKVLEQHGHTYRDDGALWLRTTDYGDDKDRVLVRSTGEHTYFASDIAYHQDKRERGFERQIDVWGADHHGYLSRMRAAYAALGGDPEHLEMLTMQLVHLVRRGERAQMSKRAGEFVTLEDLVSEVGVDAARWFLLSRSHDTTIDLDLDLARERSKDNPVYYVQYAHARIVSVLARAGPERVAGALEDTMRELAAATEDADAGEGTEALHPSERSLIKRLLAFPGEISETAQRRAPHRIATYALELAQDYTAFYEACRIVGADRPAEPGHMAPTTGSEPPAGRATVESQRLALSVAAQRTIARCLDLLGVTAPLQM